MLGKIIGSRFLCLTRGITRFNCSCHLANVSGTSSNQRELCLARGNACLGRHCHLATVSATKTVHSGAFRLTRGVLRLSHYCHLATVFWSDMSVRCHRRSLIRIAMIVAGWGGGKAEDDGGRAAVVWAHDPDDGAVIVAAVTAIALNADAGNARAWTVRCLRPNSKPLSGGYCRLCQRGVVVPARQATSAGGPVWQRLYPPVRD